MALCLLVMLLVSHEDLINVALGFLLSVFAWVFDPFQLGIGGFVLGGGDENVLSVFEPVSSVQDFVFAWLQKCLEYIFGREKCLEYIFGVSL